MPATLVVQSHRKDLPFAWLRDCLDSVAAWADSNGFDYRFIGDEMFDLVEAGLLARIGEQTVIATDLGRLRLLQQGLESGYDCVIWCDADFLIFRPDEFILPTHAFAFGREIWVQNDDNGRMRAYPKLHNAFMMFRRGNACLEFYLDTAERLVRLNQGGMPPQFIGPKLLTALHNIARFPVMDSAGMLSPLVMRDLLAGGGDALELLRQKSAVVLAGVNLSSSLTAAEGFSQAAMEKLIRLLQDNGI